VPRRRLTEADLTRVVAEEISERLSVAAEYRRAGRADRADRLEAEAQVLTGHLERAREPDA
jgi:uncharacterized protein YqeY